MNQGGSAISLLMEGTGLTGAGGTGSCAPTVVTSGGINAPWRYGGPGDARAELPGARWPSELVTMQFI